MSEIQDLVIALNTFVTRHSETPAPTEPDSEAKHLQTQSLTSETYDEYVETFEEYSEHQESFFKFKGIVGSTPNATDVKQLLLLNCVWCLNIIIFYLVSQLLTYLLQILYTYTYTERLRLEKNICVNLSTYSQNSASLSSELNNQVNQFHFILLILKNY
ncbi:hypothetical protein NPIL_217421 [Nephila pilipes]|uniref:Uncharacterized protein n=1 Tax=Nephila pilipes TaxID=299642 RepID=A0A8X6QK67_NEPPI|nr:hypothetical protein NPIL_217421 [Nephila pilipes]